MKKRKKKIILLVIVIVLVTLMGVPFISEILNNGYLNVTLDGIAVASTPDFNNEMYSVNVECENASGKWLNVDNEWKLVVDNIKGNVACSLDFRSSPKFLRDEVELKAQSKNNGYRYNGKTPDNYIWFNDELWRIIGSIPTCTSSGCATSENLVKIIRNEFIGAISYDAKSTSNATGVWGTSTLYSLLNEYYYGALNGNSSGYCYSYANITVGDCDYRNKGISPSSYSGKMVKNVYWNTGDNDYSNTAHTAYADEILEQTVSGHVGIMAASDYGYAAHSSYYNTSLNNITTDFLSTSWLAGTAFEWAGMKCNNGALAINYNGIITFHTAVHGNFVRPVVYLDSSVYVISGTGTITDPYIVGML